MSQQSPNCDRRSFLKVAGSTALAGPAFSRPPRERPNILILMTDQQRTDSLGCYGCRAIRTPNLDRLARQGALFENCYNNNPICTPSRASMLTGKPLPGHGVYRLYDTLPEDEMLVSERLRQAGYRTALFGKLHVSGRIYEAERRHPHDGFDVYEWCLEPSLSMDSPFNGYSQWLRENDPDFWQRMKTLRRKLLHHPRHLHMTYWAAERTIDFIKKSKPGQPFFCLTSIFDPHDPYEGYPLEMEKLVDKSAIPEPVIVPGEMERQPYGVRHEHQHSYLGAFDRYSHEDLMKIRFGYLAGVAFIDEQYGRILAALEEKGIADNTLVIFTSDHGDNLGDHQLLVKGASFYDSTVKVPLIARWPARFAGGRRLPQLVQLHDLAATVLSAAGCLDEETQTQMRESRDLLQLATGAAEKAHDVAVCCYRNTGITDQKVYPDPEIHATMVRQGRFKLNAFHAPPSREVIEGQLYDLRADPKETNNLWKEPKCRDVRMRLTERLLRWLAAQELRLGSRGGEIFPKPSQRVKIL